MRIVLTSIRSGPFAIALLFGALLAAPASATECWQGWGYLVEPKSLAFKSGQTLYVTDGAVDWQSREWVRLYPIDPKSGRRDEKAKPVSIKPTRPVVKGTGVGAEIVEDVAEVLGSKWSMMIRLSHIQTSDHSRTLNDKYSRWACGLQ